MKKSDKLARKTRKMIAKNLIVLAVLATVAFAGVVSWFTQNTTATASGVSAYCQLPESLEIAIVEPGETPESTDWKGRSSSIPLTGANFPFMANINMTQVTGDGKSFIKPYLSQDNVVAVVDDQSTWREAQIQSTPNVDYLSFDLYMRSEVPNCTVSLDQDTYFGPLDPDEDFETDDGSVSRNSVIGAARFSVVDASNNRKLLWIPAPRIYYAFDQLWLPDDHPELNLTNNTYGLATARSGSTLTYKYDNNFNGTFNHSYWTYSVSGTTVTPSHQYIAYGDDKASNVTANTEDDYVLPDDVSLASLSTTLNELTGVSTDNKYYYNKVRINVWLEGDDPEARAAQVGGEYYVAIKLKLN